jgi:hypothetical protein
MTDLPHVAINRTADVIGGPGSSDRVSAHRRLGKVVSIDTADVSCTVRYGQDPGSFVDIPGHRWLSGEEPALNEFAVVLSQDGANTIIGNIATTMESPVASSVPSCRRSRDTVATAGTSGSFTAALGWNILDHDTDGMASGSTVTIQTAGIYRVGMGGAWAINTTGRRIFSVFLGGTEWFRQELPAATATGGITVHNASRTASLSAGAVLDLRIFQTSGGSLDTRIDAYQLPFLEASWQSAP